MKRTAGVRAEEPIANTEAVEKQGDGDSCREGEEKLPPAASSGDGRRLRRRTSCRGVRRGGYSVRRGRPRCRSCEELEEVRCGGAPREGVKPRSRVGLSERRTTGGDRICAPDSMEEQGGGTRSQADLSRWQHYGEERRTGKEEILARSWKLGPTARSGEEGAGLLWTRAPETPRRGRDRNGGLLQRRVHGSLDLWKWGPTGSEKMEPRRCCGEEGRGLDRGEEEMCLEREEDLSEEEAGDGRRLVLLAA